MNKASITVILTLYQRPHLFNKQLTAIEFQSVRPDNLVLWVNNSQMLPVIQQTSPHKNFHIIASSRNMKFHGRFAIGLCQDTDYVCIFDDDALPGVNWLENCLKTSKEKGECILGTAGVILTENAYLPHRRIGSDGEHLNMTQQVDFVGHSWFLPTDLLKYLWYERPLTFDNGEDIALSYLAQKYGKIATYVPPHPPDNKHLHGSVFPKLGADRVAHSILNKKKHFEVRDQLVKQYINDGWQLVRNM